MQGLLWFLILPKICLSLLGHCYCSGLPYVRYAVNYSRVFFFHFKAIFGYSNALRRTFTMPTLPFAAACASTVRRASDVSSLRRDFDDPDHEIFAVLSTRLLSDFDALT